MHFSPDQWEKFIEAACRLRPLEGGAGYVFVKQLGGAGDGGRDVEARLVTDLLPRKWDLYQAKHYGAGLKPSEFFPELAKFFLHLAAGTYPTPRFYFICAPMGVGNDLHNLLSKQAEFKRRFLADWTAEKTGLKARAIELTPKVRQLVEDYDFSTILECQIRDLLAWHSLDRKAHFHLFGIEPERGDDPNAPLMPSGQELGYVEELIKVYSEHSGQPLTLDEIMQVPKYGEHFQDQRALFYCAEGLKIFSRDLYGEEEFTALMEMVLIGIRPIANSLQHSTGVERLDASLSGATSLKVSDSVLAPRLRPGDLPGTCHHLANRGRLKWVK
ncbi:ABC-three component system protein [uncultured Castellaniella sp.]|uniref:ABC-three component system protein n=1 Tax=uncultured Castellaniella sp. TaxID=647907 RepID=UPI00262021FE|nr:ABC-three component system protein [uncultured Castellaniella sp.]